MKLAFLFSGQGAQKPGMGSSFHQNSAVARGVYCSASEQLGFNVSDTCFYADDTTLNDTRYTQPCLITTEIAILETLRERGVESTACAGFSLGEYAAYYDAGILRFGDVLAIVSKRAQLMAESACGGMYAVLGKTQIIEDVCNRVTKGYVKPVNYNSPMQTVVAGDDAGLSEFIELAAEAKLRTVKLSVSGAFHSDLMKDAAESLFDYIKPCEFSIPQKLLIANHTAQPLNSGFPENLKMQCMNPVKWEQSIRRLIADGYTMFVEIGVGGVLTGLNKRIDPSVRTINVETYDDMNILCDELSAG